MAQRQGPAQGPRHGDRRKPPADGGRALRPRRHVALEEGAAGVPGGLPHFGKIGPVQHEVRQLGISPGTEQLLSTPGSGELTAFERACDDAVTAYLAQARRIPFGGYTSRPRALKPSTLSLSPRTAIL